MATRTLTQLIAGVRQLANVENNTFVLNPELTDRINEAVKELYDLVVSTYEHYFEQEFSFSLSGGYQGNTQSLEELAFYKDNTLERNPSSTSMQVVDRLPSNRERDRLNGPRQYEIKGTPPILYVFPPQSAAGDYLLRYTPDAPVLAEAAVEIDMLTGTNAVDGLTKTWTFENAAFVDDPDTGTDVGKTLTIANATNPVNNGDFLIIEVVSATEVITDGTPTSELLGVSVTASYVLAGSVTQLDGTLAKWYEYVQIRAAIDVHRKRQKISEAMELAGSDNDPRPGTLAYVRKNVLTLARNRQEQPQQVPLARRRNGFWDRDSGN